MDWLKQLLLRNWWLKLLSLGLACALWAVVTQAPPIEIEVTVPIELHQMPAALEVAQQIPAEVRLRLRGPESRLRALRPEEVGIVLDMSRAAPGNHVIALGPAQAQVPPGVKVVRIVPDVVTLELVPR